MGMSVRPPSPSTSFKDSDNAPSPPCLIDTRVRGQQRVASTLARSKDASRKGSARKYSPRQFVGGSFVSRSQSSCTGGGSFALG